ncbi:heme-containing dehydratase protein [Aspergillus pseudoustus]|uniref:Heme-containing dehydratase protein n=1 Tax=Aspergillus pseudoustus TaxID=1810923 RepID=A0ABR4IH23_9EURO
MGWPPPENHCRLTSIQFQMAFFESIPPIDSNIVYVLFGFQNHHHDALSGLKALAPELKQAASHFEILVCEQGIRTVIVLAIFESPTAYRRWWSSCPARHWWLNIPTTAGVWREVYTIPASRFQSGCNQPKQIGIGNVYMPEPSKRAGFWGAYRARVPDSANDTFQLSPVFQSSRGINRQKSTKLNPRRVRLSSNPENICFLREGQDYKIATPHERSSSDYWNMRQAADSWLASIEERWDRLGGLSFLRCSRVPDTILVSLDTLDSLIEIPTTEDCVQIALFQSLGHVERLARSSHDHLHLHSSLTELYCPMGKFKDGQSGFWVEMGILPRGGVEAEYVGCVEGTGLMNYEGHEGFCSLTPFPWLRISLLWKLCVFLVVLLISLCFWG